MKMNVMLTPTIIPADSLHKSRRWRHGDSFTHSSNDTFWRQTA
jgi:hypothetical protein